MKVGVKIKRFFRLSFRQKLLLIAVVFLTLYAYIMFRFFKHSAKFGHIDKPFLNHKTIDMSFVKDISWAINVVGKYTFWENVCRHQAYQAKILCEFFKIPYRIYVGFKKNNEGKIEGHAWTVVNDEMVTGFCKVEEYTIQNIFS